MTSKSSPKFSIRLANCVLALSKAATASNSFFFSSNLAAAAAWSRNCAIETGATEQRTGASGRVTRFELRL
ncbi:hypothetical protein A0H81_11793 [Grifola frondosa]|uniref:Uncharacterized protein n=1 Tax=Grifola frondosa TaxID=5627 RepID=A0A1C7LVT3_GRIFR|nr:hypothetical protein A0H81_11793 [Grifola frondosa]